MPQPEPARAAYPAKDAAGRLLHPERRRVEEALGWHKKAYEIRKKFYDSDPDHQNKTYSALLATSLTTIGVNFYKLGDYQKALDHHLEALRLREDAMQPYNEYIGISSNYIGGTLYKIATTQKKREAIRTAEKALEYLYRAKNIMEEIGNKEQLKYINHSIEQDLLLLKKLKKGKNYNHHRLK